ncbi:MAG: Sua5/YciO/YrdC/YwlC family protein [Bacteroidales bacterium]|nr:Sua5/YciO/YrdC/YwlC family protein [Bacteroidales bacterium]
MAESTPLKSLDAVIAEALEVLKRGGLILYPTDTVWGIGCDATNEAAVQKVFALKRRAEAKSLVLLACDLDMVARYVRMIPPIAVDLVEVNDAPMTIVYPGAIVAGASGNAAFGLALATVAADGSVGIRIPRAAAAREDDRPVSAGATFCNRLIYRLRRPLVSTSANISGEAAPSDFAAISPEIRAGVDYVVPAALSPFGRFDDSATGRPSQILKLGLDGEVEIIRP